MNLELETKTKKTIQHIVDLLVQQNFSELVKLTNGVRLNSKEIQTAISSFGRTLINVPSSAFHKLDLVPVKNSKPAKFSVWFPLWTHEEGRSDLCLQLTLIESKNDRFQVQLDDIRVP